MTKELTGICACPGEVKGTIRYYQPNKKYTKDDVVILNQWVTQEVLLLKEAGGLLSSQGSLTSHASIIAREFNIPCLINVKGLDQLAEGTKVLIDAAAEKISFE